MVYRIMGLIMLLGAFIYFLLKSNYTYCVRGSPEYNRAVFLLQRTEGGNKTQNQTRYTGYIKKNETRHIGFLKVHRTGSGTLKQIFLKFGHERNLTIILPNFRTTRMRGVISEVDTLTNSNILPPPRNSNSYDILCCHVIYNTNAFKAVLPPDTVYIGVVREPLSRFQSAIHFYEPTYILKLEGLNPLSLYSENPLKDESKDPRLSMTNNRMAVDFGFPMHLFPQHFKNDSKNEVYKYFQELDKHFRLIIVNEQFDESLVLMKRILNWSIRDILFINKPITNKFTKRNTLTESDKTNIKDFLYLDYALYEFAVKRLNKQIRQEGDSFQTEVAYFRHVIKRFKEYCMDYTLQGRPLVFPRTNLNSEFKISNDDCKLLQMKNLNDLERIRMYGSLKQ